MKSRNLIYSLVSLLSSSTISGLLVVNSTYAQSLNSEHKDHHPSTQTTPVKKQMMTHTDGHFIEMMVSHHQKALEIADIALTKAQHPEIKSLAVKIKQDFNNEIEKMRLLYKSLYGKDVPKKTMNHQDMMSGDSKMCAKMNCQMKCKSINLEALAKAEDFDKEFIRQLIPHHAMVVKMSEKVVKKTTNSEVRNLAESLIKSQNAQIKQMEQWYETWYKLKIS